MDAYTCRYGDRIVVSPAYITYRNRLIDMLEVREFRVIGKKFLINSFKQNDGAPTMCIHMESHDEPLGLYEEVIDQFYHKEEEERKSFLDWLFKPE